MFLLMPVCWASTRSIYNSVHMIQRASMALKRALWLLTKGLLTKVIVVSGRSKAGDTELKCMFVAPSLFTDNVSELIFSETPKILEERRVFTPFLRSFLKNSKPNFDMCITSLAKGYSFIVQPVATFVGQSLVDQKIDTRNGWEGVRINLSRRNRTRVNDFETKYGLSSVLSDDPNDLSFFYHQMYSPYSLARFGKRAVIDTFQQIQALFEGSFLMFILRNGERIAGVLCRTEKRRLTYFRAGIVNGDEEMLECGAMTAVYYYMVDYAVKNGLHELDALGSKPFLNDGIYRYKASWGAAAEPYEDKYVRTIHYICGNRPQEVACFFHALPTIVINNGSLRMIVGYPGVSRPTDAEVSASIDSFYSSGIRSAEVITAGGDRIRVQIPH